MRTAHVLGYLALAILTSTAFADFGVCFVGGAPKGNDGILGDGGVHLMRGTEKAGVLPRAHWNNAGTADLESRFGNNQGAIQQLMDAMGLPLQGASVTWKAENTFSTQVSDTPGDYRMMRGYLDSVGKGDSQYESSTTTVTLTLPEDYGKTGYDLYVYFDGNFTVGQMGRVGRYRVFEGKTNLGSKLGEIYGKDLYKVDFAGKFVEAKGKTEAEATAGNYVVFRGLKALTITLDATGMKADVPRAPINGIQVIQREQNSATTQPAAGNAGGSTQGAAPRSTTAG